MCMPRPFVVPPLTRADRPQWFSPLSSIRSSESVPRRSSCTISRGTLLLDSAKKGRSSTNTALFDSDQDSDSDCDLDLENEPLTVVLDENQDPNSKFPALTDDEDALQRLELQPDPERRYTITDVNGKPDTCLVSCGTVKHLKQIRSRENYLLKHEELSWKRTDNSFDEKFKLSVFYSVSPNTFQTYSSTWNNLRKNECEFTQTGLTKYFSEHYMEKM